ncbi:sterol desaturase family protein [Streptomyces sp. NPDC048172]|uniref:sterol desaturase family protein n=1 Tax=Streptomyces sp. NPDC048172 TaxID=3365505 RepID=UPI003717F4C2
MPSSLPDVVLWSIPAFVLLTVVEMVSHHLHPDEDAAGYETKDAATSITMGLGSLVFDALWKIPIVAVYAAVYELTPLRVPILWWTLPLMLLAQDFFYYWSHRGHHVIRILWACHVVHHSSEKFNFTTALRQPWTTWTVWPFYVPMIALGVHPAAVAFCSSVNLVYQFWIHTERVGKCWRPIEFVFNTPSHHRVHHASQGGYLDRNFGGILIVWDRLFRSFVPETTAPVYGLTKNIHTYNPLRVATHEYAAIARDVRASRDWRERAGRVFRGPGWQPKAVQQAEQAEGAGPPQRSDPSLTSPAAEGVPAQESPSAVTS